MYSGMQDLWSHYAHFYGGANDLEEQQRLFVAEFLAHKEGDLIEFACGNGKVISDIRGAGFTGNILGVDYNKEMIEVARARLPNESFLQGDILQAETFLPKKKYDYVICLNSLHNLPNKEMIFAFLQTMKEYTKDGGYVIFDVRNALNPGVNYGYSKNRKRGLQFYTLLPGTVKKIFEKDFKLLIDIGVNYHEAQKGKNPLKNSLLYLYFHLTQMKHFSPYRLFLFRKN